MGARQPSRRRICLDVVQADPRHGSECIDLAQPRLGSELDHARPRSSQLCGALALARQVGHESLGEPPPGVCLVPTLTHTRAEVDSPSPCVRGLRVAATPRELRIVEHEGGGHRAR